MRSQQRRTPGGVDYELTRKRVKNLNLRIRADGNTAVSAPSFVPVAEIDAFVDSRAELFEAVSREIFPLFADVLQNQPPLLKVRDMKSRWGVCCPAKRRITLALRLAEKPRRAVEYVVLHEYAHFLQLNHSPAFWAVVERFMPDYRERRALLKS